MQPSSGSMSIDRSCRKSSETPSVWATAARVSTAVIVANDQAARSTLARTAQFQGSNSSRRWDGCSAMRASTLASQACGWTPLSSAVTIIVAIAAARSAPRSEPANSHERRPRAKPLRARSAALLETLSGATAIDDALDLEHSVDAPYRFKRHRRDHAGFFAAAGIGGDVGELEEVPACMRPAECRRDRSLGTAGVVKPVVTAVGIGLQDTAEAAQVTLGMY